MCCTYQVVKVEMYTGNRVLGIRVLYLAVHKKMKNPSWFEEDQKNEK